VPYRFGVRKLSACWKRWIQFAATIFPSDSKADKDYAEFLKGIIPSEEIAGAVVQFRRYANSVAAHVQQLLGEIP
jgi:hypothetical protein